MFFLFRLAFWLGLVVLVLPTDERQQAKLYETAAATVERIATFCDRNPNACAAGAEYWAVFLKKAEFGARVAVDLVTSRGKKPETAVSSSSSPRPETPAASPDARPGPASRSTLTREDLGPAWRGSAQRTGA